ncbi:reverse transcriptase domain-containing protein [Tanacetum coccineum]
MVARMVGMAVEGDDDVWWCMTMVVAAGDGGCHSRQPVGNSYLCRWRLSCIRSLCSRQLVRTAGRDHSIALRDALECHAPPRLKAPFLRGLFDRQRVQNPTSTCEDSLQAAAQPLLELMPPTCPDRDTSPRTRSHHYRPSTRARSAPALARRRPRPPAPPPVRPGVVDGPKREGNERESCRSRGNKTKKDCKTTRRDPTDNGKQFPGQLIQRLFREAIMYPPNICSVKHSQINGLVERANCSLGEGIKARLDARSKN